MIYIMYINFLMILRPQSLLS